MKYHFTDNLLVPAKIANRHFHALIDTGASLNCIKRDFFDELRERMNVNLKPNFYTTISAANGERLNVLGITSLYFKVGGRTVSGDFYVIDNLSQTMILGCTFFQKYRATIDYAQRRVYFRKDACVLAADTASLEPNTARTVLAKVPKHTSSYGLDGVVIGAKTRSGLTIVPTAVTVCNLGYVPVLIANETDHKISVYDGQPLTSFSSQIQIGPHQLIKHAQQVANANANTAQEIRSTRAGRQGTSSRCAPNEKSEEVGESCKKDGERKLTTKEKLEVLEKEYFLDPEEINGDTETVDILYEHRRAFVGRDGKLGKNDWVKNKIQLRPGARACHRQPFRLSPAVKDALQRQIDNYLRQGILVERQSNWASPMFAIKKNAPRSRKRAEGAVRESPGHTYRLLVDYRHLNANTVVTQAHMIDARELLDRIGASKPKYITTLDCTDSYFQQCLDEDSIEYTGFLFNQKSYCFTRTPQGLAQSPFAHQSLSYMIMDRVNDGSCPGSLNIYIDDAIICSDTLLGHNEVLRRTLSTYIDANIKLSGRKCKFGAEHATFLGYKISEHGMTLSDKHLKAVHSWPTPTNAKQVKQFLGSINYFKNLIKDRGQLVKPLTSLTKKNAEFIWSEKCQSSFERLKEILCEAPVLAFPDYRKKFYLFTDASIDAIGGVLCQKDDQGHMRAISYNGRATTDAERKWPIIELEALSIVVNVKQFAHHLQGAKFEIHTDHQPLVTLFQGKRSLNNKLTRYSLFLQDYTFDIHHISGSSIVVADGLSRRPYPPPEDSPDLDPTHDFPSDIPMEKPPQLSPQTTNSTPPQNTINTTSTLQRPENTPAHFSGQSRDSRGSETEISRSREVAIATRSQTRIERERDAACQSKQIFKQRDNHRSLSPHDVDGETVNKRGMPDGILRKATGKSNSRDRCRRVRFKGAEENDGESAKFPDDSTASGNVAKNSCEDVPGSQMGDGEMGGGQKADSDGETTTQDGERKRGVKEEKSDDEIVVKSELDAESESLLFKEITLEPTEETESQGFSTFTKAPFTLEELSAAQMKDEYCRDLIDYLRNDVIPKSDTRRQRVLKREHDFMVKDNVLYQLWRPSTHVGVLFRAIVPKSLQHRLIEHVHLSNLGGHLGSQKTIALIRENYAFKGLYERVRDYVGNCKICMTMKHRRQKVVTQPGLFTPVPTFMQKLHADFAGPFEISSSGKRYVFLAVDAHSGFAFAWAMRTLSAKELANEFYKHIVCIHGAPGTLQTDNASTFTSELWRQFTGKLGIRRTYSRVYSPRTNGLVERAVSSVTELIRCLAIDHPHDWDRFLYPALYSLNATVHGETNLSPYNIVFGRNPRTGMAAQHEEETPLFQQIHDFITAQDAARKVTLRVKEASDKKQLMRRPPEKGVQQFVTGSVCFWHRPQIKPSLGKLAPKALGPYLLVSRDATSAVLRDLSTGMTLKNRVHLEQLKLASRYQIPEGVEVKPRLMFAEET